MAKSSDNSDDTIGVLRSIKQSILPHPVFPAAGTNTKRYLLRNLPLHFRPTTVPQTTLRLSLTWALGGAAVTLVLLQMATGVLLKFAYDPSPAAAYDSLQTLMTGIPFGPLVRNLHHWCANLLVLVVFLHMLRVFFTGGFHGARRFNWLVGWGLFILLLAANFTGYLLPFDQFAYWAVTVSTGMLAYVPVVGAWLQDAVRGGAEIGPGTLRLFAALHTALLPAFTLSLMAFHFWRIRKAGGLVVPNTESETSGPARVPTVPHLLVRETTAALVVVAAVLVMAALFDAPLGDPANPGMSLNPTKAPWYFAGFQELLLHLHPAAAVFWLPLGAAFIIAAIPYLRYPKDPSGVWFVSRRGKRLAAFFAAVGAIAATTTVCAKEWLVSPGASSLVVDVAAPAAIVMVLAGAYGLMRKRAVDTNEAVQAVFTMAVAAFAALTVIGFFFRGAGMQLGFPG